MLSCHGGLAQQKYHPEDNPYIMTKQCRPYFITSTSTKWLLHDLQPLVTIMKERPPTKKLSNTKQATARINLQRRPEKNKTFIETVSLI